jgi:hypothetical protein
LREASGEDLALEDLSTTDDFGAAAAVPASKEALEPAFFDVQRLKADSDAHPNSLPDWTPTQPLMRVATE